jgi:hypothetical protein
MKNNFTFFHQIYFKEEIKIYTSNYHIFIIDKPMYHMCVTADIKLRQNDLGSKWFKYILY